jgi:exopolysaccharide production protein ExoZ
MKPAKFDLLQCFRGLAALGVVLRHSMISVNDFVEPVPSKIATFCKNGSLGVDFFFVLSGFIILNSHFNDKKCVAALEVYAKKRFVRIFPPYWPISIGLLLLYCLLPGISLRTQLDFSLLSSLLLLPDNNPPVLSVGWTLVHEVLFYLLFTLFFVSNRLFILCVFGWITAIGVVGWLSLGTAWTPAWTYLMNPINLEFVLGMVMAYLIRVVPNGYGLAFILVGIITFVILKLFQPPVEELRFLFGLPFSALVLGSVLAERQKRLKIPHWMIKLGDGSYAIYLVHYPLLSLSGRLLGRLGLETWWLGMVIGIVASIAVGMLYHFKVEKPLTLWFRQQFAGKRATNTVY